MKRSSMQQRDVVPLYSDTISRIAGESDRQIVVAVHHFTIPDHRKLVVEIIERDGGRDLTLEITNRQLLKAREL